MLFMKMMIHQLKSLLVHSAEAMAESKEKRKAFSLEMYCE